jgi:hypothetical protein
VEQWIQLKIALQKEARAVSAKTGEMVQITSDPKSDFKLIIFAATKLMIVTYLPERNGIKWETASEYGFEQLEEPMESLARLLMRWLFRR